MSGRAALRCSLLALPTRARPVRRAPKSPPPRGQYAVIARPPIAQRRPTEQRAERRPSPRPASTRSNGNWEVAYSTGEKEVALVIVDPQTGEARSPGPATRSPGRWPAATRAPSATSSTRPTSSCRSARSSSRPLRLAPLRRVANLDLLVLLGFGVSHFFFNRGEIGVRCRSSTRCCSTCSAAASWIGFRGRGEGLRPVWPASVAADRGALPDRAPGRAQHRRLRARSTSATPGSSAPTGSPTANRSTTTSPKTSPRATPTARSTTSPTFPSSGSGPGREPGTTCRRPTAPRSSSTCHLRPADPPRAAGSAPDRPATARRDPRLRLGRLPLHRLRPASRTPTTRWWRCCWWPPCSSSPAQRKRGDARAGDLAKFAPAVLVPMLADLSARGPAPQERTHRLRALKRPRAARCPLRRHPREFTPGIRLPTYGGRLADVARDRSRPAHGLSSARSPTRRAAARRSASGDKCRSLEPLRVAILAAVARPRLALRLPPQAQDLSRWRRWVRPCSSASSSPLHHWFYLYIVWFYPCFWWRWRCSVPDSDARSRGWSAGTITCSIESASPCVVDLDHGAHHPDVLLGGLEADRHLRDQLLQRSAPA